MCRKAVNQSINQNSSITVLDNRASVDIQL